MSCAAVFHIRARPGGQGSSCSGRPLTASPFVPRQGLGGMKLDLGNLSTVRTVPLPADAGVCSCSRSRDHRTYSTVVINCICWSPAEARPIYQMKVFAVALAVALAVAVVVAGVQPCHSTCLWCCLTICCLLAVGRGMALQHGGDQAARSTQHAAVISARLVSM